MAASSSGSGFQGWAAISEEVREIKKSPRSSSLRTFDHLLKVIKEALDSKREEYNLAAVQRQLTSESAAFNNMSRGAIPLMMAGCSEQVQEHACPGPLQDVSIMPTVSEHQRQGL